MSPATSTFAPITALLKELHSVAVEGEACGLSADEAVPLVSHLRSYVRRLEGRIGLAEALLNQ